MNTTHTHLLTLHLSYQLLHRRSFLDPIEKKKDHFSDKNPPRPFTMYSQQSTAKNPRWLPHILISDILTGKTFAAAACRPSFISALSCLRFQITMSTHKMEELF